MFIQNSERISFYTHFTGALLGLAGLLYFVFCGPRDPGALLSLIIYGAGVVFLFSASALYHAFKREENGETFFRRLDHLAIFVMIAGTYTPLSYKYLTGGWCLGILLTQWLLVGAGFVIKFFFINMPRAVSTSLYVLMGWIVVIPLHKFWAVMPSSVMVLVAAGGIAYTAGAVIYARKKPDPLPGRFGFHEIFHLFILAGAGLHYAAVLATLSGKP
mgnify:CR=1 FL=1